MTCNHDRYRTKGYMKFKDAMKDPDICWTGIVITHCEDCGQDISQYKLVPVKTAGQWIKENGL